MKSKTFDCVEMKRKGSRKVYEAVNGMSLDQEIEYWRQRNEEMHRWLEKRKTAKQVARRVRRFR